jgi:uncharacterized pyridoxamine 5'-phosphate oxidase family protein
MRQDGNLKVIRESVKTSKHTKLQFQQNANLQIFIHLLETPDISFQSQAQKCQVSFKICKALQEIS